METKKGKPHYLKVAILAAVVAVIILGGVFGTIYAKDRIGLDVQRLNTAISIANSMHVKVTFSEGSIVMTRPGGSIQKTVDIPTLKSVSYREKTIQVVFQSLFFSQTIDIEKTDAVKTPLPVSK